MKSNLRSATRREGFKGRENFIAHSNGGRGDIKEGAGLADMSPSREASGSHLHQVG